MGLCQPARCGCGIRSSTLTVSGSGNEGDPFVINGTNPPVYAETNLPGSGVRFTGMVVSTTDTFRLLRWNGTGWTVLSEPPQAWTPTVTQSVTITVSISAAFYQRNNGVIRYYAYLALLSAGTASQIVTVGGMPKVFLTQYDYGGSFRYYDPGVTIYSGTIGGLTGSTFALFAANTNQALGPFGPHAVANSDQLMVEFWGQTTAAGALL